MAKVIDYGMASGNCPVTLQSAVRGLLAEGWQPLGGVAVINSAHDGYEYFQAMVKVGEPPPPAVIRYCPKCGLTLAQLMDKQYYCTRCNFYPDDPPRKEPAA